MQTLRTGGAGEKHKVDVLNENADCIKVATPLPSIELRYMEDVFFAYSSGSDGRGLYLGKGGKSTYDCSSMIPEVPVVSDQSFNVAVLAGDRFCGGNMCHVVFDHLCRAFLAQRIGFECNQILLFDTSWSWARFLADKVVGRCQFLENGRVYHFNKLFYFSHVFDGRLFHPLAASAPEFVAELRRFCECNLEHDVSYPSRLYQSRMSATARRIPNEAALINSLAKSGFHSVDTSDLPFLQQLKYFRNADIVVAPHGAGLCNLIACRPGTAIVEIFNSFGGTSAYEKLALSFNLNYRSIRFDSSGGSVDISEIERAIDEVFSNWIQ